jgi:von Willebrand factor type A domain-containing protein
MSTRAVSLVLSTTALGIATALSLAGGAGAANFGVTGCTPAGNVEAIIDDSGSMSSTDFNELRRTGLELFIASSSNAKKTLGAVEFGFSPADTVFAPAVVGTNRSTMIAALRAKINADNGGTEYDPAFQKAAADNPGAQARIFLTDGANNTEYQNSHRGGPKTFVVGLGIGPATASDPDAQRLQQIATETGGRYFPSVDAATLQPTFNEISAAVSCLNPPKTFKTKVFTRKGQTSTKTTKVARQAKRLDLVVNYAQPNNKITFAGVAALGKRGRVLASSSGKGKPKKLKIRKSKSTTFQALSFKKPKGTRKLRFKVKANRIVLPERAILQLTQN